MYSKKRANCFFFFFFDNTLYIFLSFNLKCPGLAKTSGQYKSHNWKFSLHCTSCLFASHTWIEAVCSCRKRIRWPTLVLWYFTCFSEHEKVYIYVYSFFHIQFSIIQVHINIFVSHFGENKFCSPSDHINFLNVSIYFLIF